MERKLVLVYILEIDKVRVHQTKSVIIIMYVIERKYPNLIL